MEGNDIAPFASITVGTLWEGVLASPPAPKKKRRWHPFGDAYAVPIKEWEAHDLPLKSAVDCVNRRGIGVDVYTCLGEEAADDVDRWLQRKGLHLVVRAWDSIDAMARDLRYDVGPRRIYVASWPQAKVIGFRATVAAADQEWPL